MTLVTALRDLARGAGFRRLLAVRLAGQCGDGVFEVTLASLFFFDPEQAGTPARVAAAFAVLLLPFTVVGPWVGVLLDRWRRRQVLLVGYGLRALGAVGVAALAAGDADGWPIYVAVLACVGVDRFLLAGLSAGLPHVVAGEDLVTANSLTPTAGTAAYGVGAGITFLLRLLGTPDPVLLLASAGLLAVASGPGPAARSGRSSVRTAWSRSPRAGAASAPGWPRACGTCGSGAARRTRWGRSAPTGSSTRSSPSPRSCCAATLWPIPRTPRPGLGLLSLVVGVSGAGFLAAAVVTPIVTGRIRPQRWIVVLPGHRRRDPGRPGDRGLAARACSPRRSCSAWPRRA